MDYIDECAECSQPSPREAGNLQRELPPPSNVFEKCVEGIAARIEAAEE